MFHNETDDTFIDQLLKKVLTQNEIDSLLANAILQRDRALRMMQNHFNELEARGQETFWIRLYLLKKAEVSWLEKQKADPTGEPDE